jgi:hypothetical protein
MKTIKTIARYNGIFLIAVAVASGIGGELLFAGSMAFSGCIQLMISFSK